MMSLRQRESLRRQHCPERVRVLFIGESPPASGRFFYRRDSGLYRAMREAFQAVDPTISEESFLEKFFACSCYFIDLCSEPVDRLDAKSRRAACADGEATLSRTIARMRPVVIATVVRSIQGNVIQAAARANWNGLMLQLPYPGRWAHMRQVFVEHLIPIIGLTLSKAVPTRTGRTPHAHSCSIR